MHHNMLRFLDQDKAIASIIPIKYAPSIQTAREKANRLFVELRSKSPARLSKSSTRLSKS